MASFKIHKDFALRPFVLRAFALISPIILHNFLMHALSFSV